MFRLTAVAVLILWSFALAQVDFREILDLTSWRGLTVASENRCSPYERDDYSFKRERHEAELIEIWGFTSPYTGEEFPDLEGIDIDHLIALSEAHDSRLCAASRERKREFGNDPDNLVFAPASLNRKKAAHDAVGWVPEVNQCWFAEQVIEIRRKYDLTIDLYEVLALERILLGCPSTE